MNIALRSLKGVIVLAVLSGALAGCATPRQAARLADLTSSQVDALNLQIEAFVTNANASRTNDAKRIAATRRYFQSLEHMTLMEVRAWQADTDDPSAKAKLAAYDALEKDASTDMATVDDGATHFTALETALQSQYGQITYSPAQLNAVVANLEAISKRATNSAELSTLYAFSKSVVSTAKSALSATALNKSGVATTKNQ